MSSRTVSLALLALSIAACHEPSNLDDGELASDTDAASEGADGGLDPRPGIVLASTAPAVDIVFVIDNSGTMGDAQGLLAQHIPGVVDALEDPGLGLDYRIAITTTDNGNPVCGGTTSPEFGAFVLSSCLDRTDEFVFNGNPPADATATACIDVCGLSTAELAPRPTTTAEDPEPAPRPWLEASPHATNLPPGISMTEALQCALPQGIAGCGFESPLESMFKALARTDMDDPQRGFLRDHAALAVMIVSDETDCSFNPEFASIFEMNSRVAPVFWTNPDEPYPTSAACWNAGVTCTGGPGSYDECHATDKGVDGSEGVAPEQAVLYPLARYVDQLQTIAEAKRAHVPGQPVLLWQLAGVPVDYPDGGKLSYTDGGDAMFVSDFGIGPACATPDGSHRAIPSVRERQVAEAFTADGRINAGSICDEDYADTLHAFVDAIRDQVPPPCLTACAGDTDPTTVALEPSCTLVERGIDPAAGIAEVSIPACRSDGSVPDDAELCYLARTDRAGATETQADDLSYACVEAGWNLELRIVRREGSTPRAEVEIAADCLRSQQPLIDCPELP